jgi:hypothetical protein
MVSLQTKDRNLGKKYWALECKSLVYSWAVWNTYIIAILYKLWPFGNLVAIWYSFPRLGTLCQEKSGNPAPQLPSSSRVTGSGEFSPM